MPVVERRYVDVEATELRVDENENVLEGYAAVFGKWSDSLGFFREKIRKGAFKRSIKNGADVKALFNHDANLILGGTKNKTLEVNEDDKGLFYRVQLPETSYAKDLYESVKRGDINQNSFGFETLSDKWNDKGDERELLEVKLFDVSPVTYPAYPQTKVTARSLIQDSGIDFDTLGRVLNKVNLQMGLTAEERQFIDNAIKILRGFIPDPSDPLQEQHSADPDDPANAIQMDDDLVIDYDYLKTLMEV